MTWIRNLIVPFALAFGVSYAYAESKRVTIYYINICDSFYSYTRVSNYNPAHCHLAALKPCVYLSPVDLGAYTYEASLVAAGATPGSFKGCYIVE
ncbi:hypothetical protein ABIE50_003176 [Chitinophaga sp. OAE865]